MECRWNRWNEEHILSHGVEPEEAEHVVEGARSPFPRSGGDDKYLVWGPTESGRLLRVVFVIDEDDAIFVIHARSLTEREKRLYRRKIR